MHEVDGVQYLLHSCSSACSASSVGAYACRCIDAPPASPPSPSSLLVIGTSSMDPHVTSPRRTHTSLRRINPPKAPQRSRRSHLFRVRTTATFSPSIGHSGFSMVPPPAMQSTTDGNQEGVCACNRARSDQNRASPSAPATPFTQSTA